MMSHLLAHLGVEFGAAEQRPQAEEDFAEFLHDITRAAAPRSDRPSSRDGPAANTRRTPRLQAARESSCKSSDRLRSRRKAVSESLRSIQRTQPRREPKRFAERPQHRPGFR